MKITPVIMSGGSGTRLWPVSRKTLPKQFHNLLGEETLFVETIRRLSGDIFNPPLIVCNFEHRFLVAETLRQENIVYGEILLEPEAKNTAPALIVAAQYLLKKDEDCIIIALPCDHNIQDLNIFIESVKIAYTAAKQDKLVTFGVKPNSPHTGYGYIQKGAALAGHSSVFEISKFHEKPQLNKAQEYLSSEGFLWNSGMFLYKAKTFLQEINEFEPVLVKQCLNSLNKGHKDLGFININKQHFNKIQPLSIDYALWEKTQNAVTVPIECGWTDIGSWSTLAEISESDDDQNVISNNVVIQKSKNCFVRSDGKLIALLGVSDLTVIADDDAILVCSKSSSQDIKMLVDRVSSLNYTQATQHTKVYRPWGWYEIIDVGEYHKVKRISVNPGASLSLQKHQYRSEHWVVVSGTATITNNDVVSEMSENQSTYIPAGIKHKLENKTKKPLKIIEVQTGPYLEEDDIVRFDDSYNRVDTKKT